MARLLIAAVVGVAAFAAVMVTAALTIAAISKATHSGLLGICGPYGSDPAIVSMLAVLSLSLIAGTWLAIVAGRRPFRSLPGKPPAGGKVQG